MPFKDLTPLCLSGIFEVLEITGKEKTLKRLEKAIKTIG